MIVSTSGVRPRHRHQPVSSHRSPSTHLTAPSSPLLLTGILSHLAEIVDSLHGSFSCAAAPSFQRLTAPALAAVESQQATAAPPLPAAVVQIADNAVGAVRSLAAWPEVWIDFPLIALDDGNYLSRF